MYNEKDSLFGSPLPDPRLHHISNSVCSQIYCSTAPNVQANGYMAVQRSIAFSQHASSTASNSALLACNSATSAGLQDAIPLQQAAGVADTRADQNNSNLMAQLSQQMHSDDQVQVQGSSTLQGRYVDTTTPGSVPWLTCHGDTPPMSSLQHPVPINQDHARLARTVGSWASELEDKLASTEQQLHSQRRAVARMKHCLARQKKDQVEQGDSFVVNDFMPSLVNSGASTKTPLAYTYMPLEPMTPPLKQYWPQMPYGPPYTSMNHVSPASWHYTSYSAGSRHHRTATPEQRAIRKMMGGKPVYTMGIDPQNDRCLLADFFTEIKRFAETYTVQIRALNAEQVHGLSANPAIASSIGKPSLIMTLVTEKDMLIAMVALAISKHMWTYALDETSLYSCGHSHAMLTEDLTNRWARLGDTDYEAKHNLLLVQQQIYTSIKEDANHKTWRAATAERLTNKLLFNLLGLLATNLPAPALKERNHILSELHVKAYRIGFRLRMAAVKWTFCWPSTGAVFESGKMVNESRTLYGDVLCTMNAVAREPDQHVVLFALSPTVVGSEYAAGVERKSVVHHAMVHLTRKGWL